MDNDEKRSDGSIEPKKRPEAHEAQASPTGFGTKWLQAAFLLLLAGVASASLIAGYAGTPGHPGQKPGAHRPPKTHSPLDELPPEPPDIPVPKRWEDGEWWTNGSLGKKYTLSITNAGTRTMVLRATAKNRKYRGLLDLQLAAPGTNPLTLLLRAAETNSPSLHVTNDCFVHPNVAIHVRKANLVVDTNLVVGGYLTLESGSVVVNSNMSVGEFSNACARVSVTGGRLVVTNEDRKSGRLIIGSNRYEQRKGRLVIVETNRAIFSLDGGLVEADFLQVEPGSLFWFKSGTLKVGSMLITNGPVLPYIVGDGVSQTTLALSGGGTSDYSGGLIVTSNATLRGNGTVCGWVANYGTILAGTKDDQLTFAADTARGLTSVVTNWGSMYMTNSGKLSFQGTVCNNVAVPFIAIHLDSNRRFCTNQFASVGGLTNILECKGNVADTNSWTPLVSTLGTGEILTLIDASPPATNRFYRIRLARPDPPLAQ